MQRFIEEGLFERIQWLIRLRWIAILGVFFTVLFVTYLLKLPLPVFALYAVSLILLVYNLIFSLFYHRLRAFANSIANLQISLDLLSLALLIHFSGGIENPFIFYFIFHMIIASTLLSRRASFLQATFAVLLFLAIVVLEYAGILSHYCLKGFISFSQHENPVHIAGVSFVFISTLYISVYMATSIAVKLRQKEKSLKEANLLLEEKDRIKSEYVLRVSHDIKEHLAAIQGCVEPVTRRITGELNERQSDLLKRATERTKKLTFFVKALLEITRLKLSRRIDTDYFSLKKTIENAISFVDTRAKDKDILISFNIDPDIDTIKGAQIYIEETMANLLANAVKYTPQYGRIYIKVEDKSGAVLIQITDTGIGIPKEELPHIFEEFYRASNAKKVEKYGTGLGLSMAKQVIEMHRGKIWVESEENKGSSFYILLPK